MDQAREQVAAQFVGAEQKLPLTAFQPYRWGEQKVAVLLAGVMGRNPRGEQGAEYHQQHECQAGERTLVVAEGLPELPERRGIEQRSEERRVGEQRRSRGAP